MKYLETIKSLNLMSIGLLYFGLDKGWSNKQAIIDQAMADLDESNAESKLAYIALNQASDSREFKELVNVYLTEIGVVFNKKTERKYKEQWLLIKLVHLNQSENDAVTKLEKLQIIYADFDYPEEMKSCSIYSNDSIDPQAAMVKLIEMLKLKYSPV